MEALQVPRDHATEKQAHAGRTASPTQTNNRLYLCAICELIPPKTHYPTAETNCSRIGARSRVIASEGLNVG